MGKQILGGKGLQTTWFLLLIVELVSSQSLHEHCLYNLYISVLSLKLPHKCIYGLRNIFY